MAREPGTSEAQHGVTQDSHVSDRLATQMRHRTNTSVCYRGLLRCSGVLAVLGAFGCGASSDTSDAAVSHLADAGPDAGPMVAISVRSAGSGAGIVVSDPPGISCPGSCVSSFPVGSTVLLTSMPFAASTFVGWDG